MVLETSDFRVSYGRIAAVKGLSIAVGEDEAVAVIGANGANQDLLLAGLAGLVDSSGGASYKGSSLSGLSRPSA